MKKQIFMTTVSTLALTSASAGMVMAEDAAFKADPKFTLTLEGGFGRLDNAPMDKWGASGGLNDKVGVSGNDFSNKDMSYTGAISLKRSIGENRDVRVGLGFGGNPSNEDVYSSSYSDGDVLGTASTSVTNDFGFTTLDIDTGRSMQLSAGNVTAFGGLRGLVANSASTNSVDKIGSSGGNDFSAQVAINMDSSFVGLGPRIGAGFDSKPFAGGFGVSAEVAVGAVYGQRTDRGTLDKVGTNGNGDDFGPATVGNSQSDKQIVKTVDAKASLDYHFSENATLSLGYQARQFWNVDVFSDPDNNTATKNRLVDGAFIAFTTTF